MVHTKAMRVRRRKGSGVVTVVGVVMVVVVGVVAVAGVAGVALVHTALASLVVACLGGRTRCPTGTLGVQVSTVVGVVWASNSVDYSTAKSKLSSRQ